MLGRAEFVFICLLQFLACCSAEAREIRAAKPDCLTPPIKGELTVNCGFHCKGYPFQQALGDHAGADLQASESTPVYASEAGVVVMAGADAADTNIVAVLTKRGWVYRVLHLKSYAVKKGDKVFRGQFLGRSGGVPGKPGSGKYTTGAHLHFDLTVGNDFVDPMPYLCPTP